MSRAFADALHALLLLALAAALAWISVQWQFRADFSHGQRASLSPATRAVLAALDGPVEVVCYARPGGELRGRIAAFFARYTQVKPDLVLRFVDPDADPGAMRARGITLDGEIALNHAGRSQRVVTLDERSVTRALHRLARAEDRVLAFIGGHGERQPDREADHDLSRLAAALAEQGLRAVPLNLANTTAIPANVAVVVVASPTGAWAPGEIAQLRAWIDEGGALLWLTEPDPHDAGLAALADTLGLRVLEGRLVDATGQGLGVGDPSFVAATRYPEHPVSADFALTTLYPQVAALAVAAGAAFDARPLLRSAARSWLETGPVSGEIAWDAEAGELPGPLDYGIALTRLSPSPARVEQRIIVIGDGDFLSNRFLGNGGNLAFATRVLNWLSGDDALIEVPIAGAPDRQLSMTRRVAAILGFGWLIAVPLLLFGTGALRVWRRRR